MLTIISLIILIFSIVIHEVSHGLMAERLGDPTARLQGRLTLNPLKHIDPLGSIVVPLATYLLGGFAFGWAKPVIYNPYNLKNRRLGEALIAFAGPASNLLIALIFGLIVRFVVPSTYEVTPSMLIFVQIILTNITLAVFNLVPLPPLDGSKLIFALFPDQYGKVRVMLETYAPVFVFIAVFFLWKLISPIIPLIFRLFTGLSI